MAGPTSEAGYLNIGTAENSSHPEIEPEIEDVDSEDEPEIEDVDSEIESEIEDVDSEDEPEIEDVDPEVEPEIEAAEASGDSDEVCGLERKEYDLIMEHLKKNPGLVVKSLGSEGRIVLHEAIMADDTKKPKPPASKCTNKGFSQAAVESGWYRALEIKNCKALMALLKANPCLVAQTGPQRRTVLHAAAERGCLKLLVQVSDLFKVNVQFALSGVKVAWRDLVRAKCGTFEAEAHHMAWFTCPRQVWKILRDGGRLTSTQGFTCVEPRHLTDKLVEIMQREPAKEAFKCLEKKYRQDLNYNFILERKELQFHYACRAMSSGSAAKVYVKSIIDGCLALEPSESVEVLTHLLELQNAQGQTPLHVTRSGGTAKLLELVPASLHKKCLNAKDVRGWTVLHCLVATGDHRPLEIFLKMKNEGVDENARTTPVGKKKLEAGMTALHLAILHNNVRGVELLLTECSHTDVNALLYRYIVCGYERMRLGDDTKKMQKIQEERSIWSPLQLAAIMGLSHVVRALLELKFCNMIYDDGKFQKTTIVKSMGNDFRKVSALLLASASGNPDTLRLFLNNSTFNPSIKFKGATALHYAANAMIPKEKTNYLTERLDKVGPLLRFTDCGKLNLDTCTYKGESEDIKLSSTSYLGREACITMLLEAGVDIWAKDDLKRFAEPGPQAPEDALLWWYEIIAQETLEAKKSLNDAANAISVVAALVATASFVGPLQPPLGYGGDSVEGGIQNTHLSIRVFLVSNILSFYLAVASIMFAVVPSLPMPQEGIYTEWQRTRKTVGVAIFFLLMSVLGVLLSFGAASNSIVSEDYSWRHVGLSFYPTLFGGFICIISISLFFLRLLRLIFHKNDKIRALYKLLD